MILNIPHASKYIPIEIREQFNISNNELKAELLHMTDSYTDELFCYAEALRIIFPVSRLVVDPERFLEDAQEPMSSSGMGVVYTRTYQGLILRKELSKELKEKLIKQYYIPYHSRLAKAVKDEREQGLNCLLVDCHSFSSVPLPHEIDRSARRPDICIGTDEYHTPDWLAAFVEKQIKKLGFSVKLNSPFNGTLVPLTYYHNDPHVLSIMFEINRCLYMNENTGKKNASFGRIQEILTLVLSKLSAILARYR